MKRDGGWWWPDGDRETPVVIRQAARDIPIVLGMVPGNGLVIQAGGNVGVYPMALADHFDRVLTFEPDPANFEALEANTRSNKRITRIAAALADEAGTAAVERQRSNCGASRLAPGTDVAVTTIDGMRVEQCDLIWLDIEGYEGMALEGARETLASCRPWVVVEMKGLGEAYGWPDLRLDALMREQGYRRAAALHRDVVWKPA